MRITIKNGESVLTLEKSERRTLIKAQELVHALASNDTGVEVTADAADKGLIDLIAALPKESAKEVAVK